MYPKNPVHICRTWVTSGCRREAEPFPTHRTANLRQRQHRSTILLSAWWAFRVSESTGQIYGGITWQRYNFVATHQSQTTTIHYCTIKPEPYPTGEHYKGRQRDWTISCFTSWMTFWQGWVCPFSTMGFVCLEEGNTFTVCCFMTETKCDKHATGKQQVNSPEDHSQSVKPDGWISWFTISGAIIEQLEEKTEFSRSENQELQTALRNTDWPSSEPQPEPHTGH